MDTPIKIPLTCPSCNYNLRGLTIPDPCPECGTDPYVIEEKTSIVRTWAMWIGVGVACGILIDLFKYAGFLI